MSEIMKKALTDKSARNSDSMISASADKVAGTQSYWA